MARDRVIEGVRPEEVPAWARAYDAGEHPRFAYTGDALVFGLRERDPLAPDGRDLVAAIVERGRPPFAGYDAWPGGFVEWDTDESAEAAAARELEEEAGLRRIGYSEPLDTYDANGRDPRQFAGAWEEGRGWVSRGARVVSRAFLYLSDGLPDLCAAEGEDAVRPRWVDVADHLPWEDLRSAHGHQSREACQRMLRGWADGDRVRLRRISRAFAGDSEWSEERAGERVRLLLEAQALEESARDRWGRTPGDWDNPLGAFGGRPLAFDHRMMMADALGRVRGKIKYVPRLLRALTGPDPTMVELWWSVAAVAGRPVDKSNFWRLFSRAGHIVERTGRKQMREGAGPLPEIYRYTVGIDGLRLDPALRLPFTPIP